MCSILCIFWFYILFDKLRVDLVCKEIFLIVFLCDDKMFIYLGVNKLIRLVKFSGFFFVFKLVYCSFFEILCKI